MCVCVCITHTHARTRFGGGGSKEVDAFGIIDRVIYIYIGEADVSTFLLFFFFSPCISFQLVNGLDRPRYVCETEVMEEVNVATATPVEYTPPGNTNKNANGNIITLTLKNNHLIVETEERAVSTSTTHSRSLSGRK